MSCLVPQVHPEIVMGILEVLELKASQEIQAIQVRVVRSWYMTGPVPHHLNILCF